MQPGLNDIRNSALWHLYDYDADQKNFTLRRIEEDHYRKLSFLDQRIEATCREAYRYSIEHLADLFPEDQVNTATVRFIFHIGHCGSTLMSRLLAADPDVLPVREPLTLRRLAAEYKESGSPTYWNTFFSATVQGLGRRFNERQVPVVKATSTCNALIEPLLNFSSDSHALGIYVRLKDFLAGMLGRQNPVLDLQGHLPHRRSEWLALTGNNTLPTDPISDAQAAVVSWLTSMARLLHATEHFPQRFMLLDFEEFLQNAPQCLRNTAQFLHLEPDVIAGAWPSMSQGYSKDPSHPYTPENRRMTLDRGRQLKGAEIEQALAWASQLIDDNPSLLSCRAYL